mgnify:CR=1 FL=1
MLVIDNDYMINKRGIDLHARLKVKDNQSGAVQIFFEQLSFRLLDYILTSSTRFADYEQLNKHIDNMSDFAKEQYKRALAEQALYLLSMGDINYLRPDGTINYEIWQQMRICPQTRDILRNLGLLKRTARIGSRGQVFPHQDFDNEFI